MRLDQQKRDLRSSFRQRADLFQPHQAAFVVERLNDSLDRFLKQQSGIWAAFKGRQHEPRLDTVLAGHSQIQWVFPRLEEQSLVFVASKEFSRGQYGIEEPQGGRVIETREIQGFLVPGIAFDKTGTRLGRGKGHYDRALSEAPGFLMGVCFGFQIFEGDLPYESNDVKMDFLMSEQGFMTCRGTEKG